ncbi:pirin family protein [Aliarcobacter thereius]|uniref:Quercetin 2,3-dioxygenase n=2 Tax=Aliarcobacter thereius TaxID=544718 RepID=A0A1C0B9X2_9BACT|nr:pirin family protein [Aliarcobacter thereius]OCL91978.1 Quercetin 2,3-dioxygenase [Aliarcobacter thereius]OCL94924.1 Quercetin 2,3-dioxygenase [Aliarcobacter thereius LMG 24486]OCM00372.1 Quercetin 2,3-dioxygenase [Aliarcobacter thereius]QBF15204.1 pirin family protein [Aliarcobacter thereius LMG 24486]TLS91943.1 pirin family protein [Aliarcobacter thereius]
MIRKLKKENMGTSNLAWLESRFHFSFAEYRNPENINFGVLRVLNDDIIHPKSGFDTHPHANMEIISYIVDGEITHKDSMGNSEVLKRGEVQYLSAGDGIYHSEHNLHESEDLRLLQIWIIPPKKSLARLYGSHKFTKDERDNKLLNIVSSQNGDAPIKIYQDVNIYVAEFDKDFEFDIKKDRQIYFVLIEGSAEVNGETLNFGDAMELVDEEKLKVNPITKSHILFIEMKK